VGLLQQSRLLSCPVVRPATQADASELAELVVNSNSKFIESVFDGDILGGYHVLEKQFRQYNEGLYVLTEAETIIGVMKLHLPDQLIGNTLSFIQLIKILGFKKGIRAGILLSHWDEYKPKPEEAYIEYLYVHQDWEHFNVVDILLDRANQKAAYVGAKYLTHFIPVNNYKAQGRFKDNGFVLRRKIHSVLAKFMGSNYSAWYKATYSITEEPITVKEYVVEKIDTMRDVWNQRRREIFAAARLTVALTIIPLLAGSLAYIRGFPIAAGGWALIATAHLLGVKLYLSGSMLGRYGLIVAMVSEGINLFARSINTGSWFDRSWLLPLSLLTFWIVSVLLRNPSAKFSSQITAA